MTFDPETFRLDQGLLQWCVVFGAVSTVAALFIVLVVFVVDGRGGVAKVFRAILAGMHQKILGALVGLAGLVALAVAGWLFSPAVLDWGWQEVSALFGGRAAAPGGILLVSRFVGAALGALVGLATGLMLGGALADTFNFSVRRVYALSMLTFREAIRRKALGVFVVFAILFMFAGWFLTDANTRPEYQVKVYVSFVLTAITWLVLPVMLLLSCWGIPEDIRTRSLHTVVTKPVRRSEIVLGRILGFTAIGTLVLAVMSVVGFIWIVRQVPARAQSELVCRVPVFGSLGFLDRQGEKSDKGINVGDVWEFNSFIEGGTKARALWTFQDITPDSMVDVANDKGTSKKLLLESRFQAFRTYKGNMDRATFCQLVLVNEKNQLSVPLPPYSVKEFEYNVIEVDRKVTYYDDKAKAQRTLDVFDDLAPDGTLTVHARCVDPGQFLGMARPGLFLRTPDRHFASGFFKAAFGVWMMMTVIIIVGVTAGCFVKGPVATVLTLALLLVGTGFHDFLEELASGKFKNSGAVESVVRIVRHTNPIVDLEPTGSIRAIQAIDRIPKAGLWVVAHVIPDFNAFSMHGYVANGFDVPFNSAIAPALATLVAYLIPCLLLGYFSLRLRELEAK